MQSLLSSEVTVGSGQIRRPAVESRRARRAHRRSEGGAVCVHRYQLAKRRLALPLRQQVEREMRAHGVALRSELERFLIRELGLGVATGAVLHHLLRGVLACAAIMRWVAMVVLSCAAVRK